MQNRDELLQQLPKLLLPWYRKNKRDLPWRKNTDPYRILVSEVMLQQTRVEAVIDKYNQFMQRLPTVTDLANCNEEELLKLWEGLGYYSRARNLQKAAKEIAQNGFAHTAKELIKLKGVGAYTAGAIASIAFEEKAPAVDGNVIRVLARYLHDAVEQDILREEYFEELAPIYPEGACGDFTQSLMELGATICTPKSPRCELCPLLQHCKTKDASLPLKKQKLEKKEENYTLLLFHDSKDIVLIKRTSGVLKNLFGFYMLNSEHFTNSQNNHTLEACYNLLGELDTRVTFEDMDDNKQHVQRYLQQLGLTNFLIEEAKKHKHVFTHIIWHMTAYPIYLPDCKTQLTKLQDYQDLYFFDKTFIENNISLPSAFRWCLKYI